MREDKKSTDSKNAEFLNAYRIHNREDLSWEVAIYKIVQLNGDQSKNEDRGKIKSIMWDLRWKHKGLCPGYGFIFDVDKTTVAIPKDWNIPQQNDFKGYRVTRGCEFKAEMSNPDHRVTVTGILRESIKQHFKNVPSDEIGPFWQYFNNFCQMPDLANSDQDIIYCRRFHVSPELLENNLWVLQTEIRTKSIDGRTFADYYRSGEVEQLAEMIRLKRENRLTRQNQPSGIQVWHFPGDATATVLELDNPDEIVAHAKLDPMDQIIRADQTLLCKQYKKPPISVPLNEIRFIPDSGIAQERHQETIIAPEERANWYDMLHDFLNGLEVYGQTLNLAEAPINTQQFETIQFVPPKLRVNLSLEGVDLIPAPTNDSGQELKYRRRRLFNHIHKNGYLQQRPINPLLVYPQTFGQERANRLKSDLNRLITQNGLDFRFEAQCAYRTVHDIRQEVEREKYDTLFAVLPEGRHKKYFDTDMHEKIKQEIPIPSQCIHHDNTLPRKWVDRHPGEFRKANPRAAHKIQDRYKQCILNLLVKHHWVPFAPAEPFHYNVHLGIDVGGVHNNRVMVCAGYGFAQPSEGLIFLLKEVNIQTQKAEPIPDRDFYRGLFSLLDELYQGLINAGIEKPDFNSVLFFRDGKLGGQGDYWNEKDTLDKLCKELQSRKWIDNDALWTALEISKRAAFWRALRRSNNNTIESPTVGRCVFPFPDKDAAITCTTGEPYLSRQGTASPLLVRVHNIYGIANPKDALRDLFWETDMCFSKIDTGTKLPWVLHVANKGALQLSKAYQITGVTV